MNLIKEQSSLGELLVRPLSAKLLEETLPEKEGIIQRNELLDIEGRSRKRQLALAKKYGIKKFSPPGASCLLTDPLFAAKIKDLMERDMLTLDEVALLKCGRQFRLDEATKAVVGREEKDNDALVALKKENDIIFRLANDLPGPYALLRGKASSVNIGKTAALVVSHSKYRKEGPALVEFWSSEGDVKVIEAASLESGEIEELKI